MKQIKTSTVHKFGGSTLVDSASYQTVATRLTGNNEIIVVSALYGTTQALQNLLDNAARGEDFKQAAEAITQKHLDVINALFTGKEADTLREALASDISDLHELLHATSLINDYSPKLRDRVVSYGEIWSARTLTTLLSQKHKTLFINASDILFCYKHKGSLYVDWKRSEKALDEHLKDQPYGQYVITGFIASDVNNKQITLGRNGSDFSAAIFAKLFSAEKLVIWKDVAGIYSADPKRVRSAFPIKELSYASALELAYFGAAVIHPRTLMPAMKEQIPIYIKNTLDPDAPGTLISATAPASDYPVQGITSIDKVALVTIEGTGLIGVSGTAVRVFQVIEKENISVILISQGSSEHSICFAVSEELADRAVNALKLAFEFEMQQQLIERIYADANCAILAAVGDGMVGTIGICGKLTSTLTTANVNIKAIAQGSSERNISLVLSRNDINKALNAVHAAFYLSDKTLSIGLIGPGLVGGALLEQIKLEIEHLQNEHHIKLMVRGICNSTKMLLSHKAINLENWETLLEKSNVAVDLAAFNDHITADDMPNAVIIDCTANDSIAKQYTRFMKQGSHIITPNKRASSGDVDYYEQLKSLSKETGKHYLYETTVCAGLPIITTLDDIIKTGDTIINIEGVVSGTLSYVFSQLALGIPFSTVIKDAKAKGFTEPDPREDLAGMDVARKIVILAREIGHKVKLIDVNVHNLVPEALRDGSVEHFMNELPKYDDEIKQNIDSLGKPDEKAAYIGSIDKEGTVCVGIKAFSADHPFARLKGTDNMLIFHSERYCDQPLIVQGPGAGAKVTAAGVFADLLRLASFITQ